MFWLISGYDGAGITLAPSIGNWNFPCQSHYWIVNSEVRWARQWSLEEISAVREKEQEKISGLWPKNNVKSRLEASGNTSKNRKTSDLVGCRYKAEIVNETFEAQLNQFTISSDYAELFKAVIIDTYKSTNQTKEDYSRLVKDIDDENTRVRKARELLLAGDIDGGDFKIIKSESEKKIEGFEAKLSEVIQNQNAFIDIEPLVGSAIDRLTKLDIICYQSDNSEKRELIGSMYAEKFTFEELQHRTAKTTDLYSFIYLIKSELGEKKRRANNKNLCLPSLAPEAGLEPATL